MTRRQGEHARINEQLARLEALIDGLRATLRYDASATEAATAVAEAAMRTLTIAARIDAYRFAEDDAKAVTP